MKVPRSLPPSKKRRSVIRLLFTFVLTTTMIATAGFGALPKNPLTDAFQTVIGENFPPELLIPFNSYMGKVSAPQISPGHASGSDGESPLDPVGALMKLFETETSVAAISEPSLIEETLVAVAVTQSQIAFIQNQNIPVTGTQTQIQTQTQMVATSLLTSTLPPTSTPIFIPTATFRTIYIPPTSTSVSIQVPTITDSPVPTATPAFTDTPTDTPTATVTNTPTSTLTPTNTPTLVPGHLTLYFGSTSAGNIGPRSSADALCTANLPAGFSNYHAFIAYSTSDSIANMPLNYAMPTNLPIQSVTNIILANNWADLMDSSIAVSLSAANVTPPGVDWWSGAENADGTHMDAVTADCNEWTSNSIAVGGNAGLRGSVNANWMDFGSSAACDQLLAVLCIAY